MITPPISPAQRLTYDSVVRLTQFTPKDGGNAPDAELVEAWQLACAEPVEGIVYRELCRQVPEWSQLAHKEIDHPVEATYLEYLIASPEIDLDGLPALPATCKDRYTVTQDVHSVAFRLVKPDENRRPGALMFNLFEIDGPAGMEQGFLMDWPARGAFKIGEDATFATVLHQRMLTGATIKAFNRAEVLSADAYAEGIDRFEAAFPHSARKAAAGPLPPDAKPPIRSRVGLFEIVALAPAGAPLVRETMKAVVAEEFGSPAVLRLREVPRPAPGPGQIRVRVRACCINPLDVKMRSGDVRHIYPSWFPDVYGYSVAGVVDAVGQGVTDRQIGEEVYGINNPVMRHGYAEYVCGPSSNFYPKPNNLDDAAAAAAPSIFATAYGGLFLRYTLEAGQTVLIHGGSGVVGSCAVQLAKQAGARVIATASPQNVERVRALGADVVVDYKMQRFEDFAHDVDLVLDTVGGGTRERSWPLIRKGGALASLLPPPPDPETAARYGVQAFMVHGHPNIVEIMPEMTRRLVTGELAPPEIAALYPLSEAAAAHTAFEANPRGRIVLQLD